MFAYEVVRGCMFMRKAYGYLQLLILIVKRE